MICPFHLCFGLSHKGPSRISMCGREERERMRLWGWELILSLLSLFPPPSPPRSSPTMIECLTTSYFMRSAYVFLPSPVRISYTRLFMFLASLVRLLHEVGIRVAVTHRISYKLVSHACLAGDHGRESGMCVIGLSWHLPSLLHSSRSGGRRSRLDQRGEREEEEQVRSCACQALLWRLC